MVHIICTNFLLSLSLLPPSLSPTPLSHPSRPSPLFHPSLPPLFPLYPFSIQWCPCIISGPVGPLTDLFTSLCSVYYSYKAGGSKNNEQNTNTAAVAAVLSAIVLRFGHKII